MSKYIFSAILFAIALIIELIIAAKVNKKIGWALVVCTVIVISICIIYAVYQEVMI